jgi:hypothetical protein
MPHHRRIPPVRYESAFLGLLIRMDRGVS